MVLANYKKLILAITLVSTLIGFITRALFSKQFKCIASIIWVLLYLLIGKNVMRNTNQNNNCGQYRKIYTQKITENNQTFVRSS